MTEQRKIKFRGLTKDGEWVYGWYVFTDNKHYICYDYKEEIQFIEVSFETVGQYIDLKDKNRKEIYAGDKVRGKCTRQKHQKYNPFEGIIEWSKQYALFQVRGEDADGDLICPAFNEIILAEIEVIGDIHTTPKLSENK